jgi:hypothetical protein
MGWIMKNTGEQIKTLTFFTFLLLATVIHAQTFPEFFCVFREAVYKQNTAQPELMRLYTMAKQDIERECIAENLYLTLSRCEYLMGLSYWVRGEK